MTSPILMLSVSHPVESGFFASPARPGGNAADLPQGLVVHTVPVAFRHRREIAAFAAAQHLPSVGEASEFARDGLLLSYGPDITTIIRRAGYYVDRLLRGAKAAELPVEQPTKFELVINLKTAKALGLTIPPNVLARRTR